jgi:hypothetical protein
MLYANVWLDVRVLWTLRPLGSVRPTRVGLLARRNLRGTENRADNKPSELACSTCIIKSRR